MARRNFLQWRYILPVLVIGLFGLERYASEPYKPSTISGGLLGHEENVRLRTQLEAAQATVAAQNTENARMQQEVELFRARTERVTEAYKVLFQRATVMQQAMAQTQQQVMVLRQQMEKDMEGGNVNMAQAADTLGLLGRLWGPGGEKFVDAADKLGQAARSRAMAGFDSQMRQGLVNSTNIFNNWQEGLPDVERIDQVVQQDRIAPLQPAPRPAPPLPPPAYQTAPSSSPPALQSAALTPAARAPEMQTASLQTSGPASAVEAQGAAAWNDWKSWEDAQTGKRKAGVEWWAANRNVPKHPTCAEAARRSADDTAARQEFEAGCLSAKSRLEPLDNRRNADYDFNKGFNVAAGGSPPPILTELQKKWCAAHDLVIIACNSRFKPK